MKSKEVGLVFLKKSIFMRFHLRGVSQWSAEKSMDGWFHRTNTTEEWMTLHRLKTRRDDSLNFTHRGDRFNLSQEKRNDEVFSMRNDPQHNWKNIQIFGLSNETPPFILHKSLINKCRIAWLASKPQRMWTCAHALRLSNFVTHSTRFWFRQNVVDGFKGINPNKIFLMFSLKKI